MDNLHLYSYQKQGARRLLDKLQEFDWKRMPKPAIVRVLARMVQMDTSELDGFLEGKLVFWIDPKGNPLLKAPL